MTYLRSNSCLAVDRSLSPILLGLHAAAQMGACQVWTWGKGAGVARGEVAIPVPARRTCLGASSSLVASSACGPHARRLQPLPSHILRVQAASVRSVLGTQPASECGRAGHWGLMQDIDSRVSLGMCPCPWGSWGGSGPSPSHPKFLLKGLTKMRSLFPWPPTPNVNHISFMAFSFSEKHIV